MKSLLALASCALLFLFSCKKPDNSRPAAYPGEQPYRVSGLLDVAVERSPFRQWPVLTALDFSVLYQNGPYSLLTLGFEGLPVGLLDSYSVQQARPDFTTTVSFLDRGVAAGSYQPSLVIMPESGADTLRFPFKMRIVGDTVCSNYFPGRTWKAKTSCYSAESAPYTVEVLQIGNTDSLLIRNFDNAGREIRGAVDCSRPGFLIPTQTIGGKVFAGTGGFSTVISPTSTAYGGHLPNTISLYLKDPAIFGSECTYIFTFQ